MTRRDDYFKPEWPFETLLAAVIIAAGSYIWLCTSTYNDCEEKSGTFILGWYGTPWCATQQEVPQENARHE